MKSDHFTDIVKGKRVMIIRLLTHKRMFVDYSKSAF